MILIRDSDTLISGSLFVFGVLQIPETSAQSGTGTYSGNIPSHWNELPKNRKRTLIYINFLLSSPLQLPNTVCKTITVLRAISFLLTFKSLLAHFPDHYFLNNYHPSHSQAGFTHIF